MTKTDNGLVPDLRFHQQVTKEVSAHHLSSRHCIGEHLLSFTIEIVVLMKLAG